MKKRKLAIAILMSIPLGQAQAAYDFSIGISPWSSQTNYSYEINSAMADPKYGTPTSELIYKKMTSTGLKLNLELENELSYYYANFTYGTGSSDGTMIDNDYYSQQHVGYGNPNRYLSTKSDAGINQSLGIKAGFGSKYYFNYLLADSAKLGFLMDFTSEDFETRGLDVLEDPYLQYTQATGAFSKDEVMIKTNLQKISVGIDAGISKQLTKDIDLNWSNSLILFSSLKAKDTHLKRQDMGDPSLLLNTKNYGIDTTLSLNYQVSSLTLTSGVNYTILKPYGTGTAEVFDKNNKSLGAAELTGQDYSSLTYFAGINYKF